MGFLVQVKFKVAQYQNLLVPNPRIECYAFRFATANPRESNESGIHHQANPGRDFKIESGIASTRRREEGQGTAQNISGRQEENRGSTEKKMGENQGGQEIEKSDLV